MTIVRSLGVTTLVALMSAHRSAAQRCDTMDRSFDQAAVEAIEAYLRSRIEAGKLRHLPVGFSAAVSSTESVADAANFGYETLPIELLQSYN